MRQKFRRLTFVKVDDEMPPMMTYFEAGFIGIVDCTYSQAYGGGAEQLKKYSLFQIEGDKIVNTISWYHEHQLTALAEQDRDKAEEMVDEYQTRGYEDEKT